jgi:hypothetical protein
MNFAPSGRYGDLDRVFTAKCLMLLLGVLIFVSYPDIVLGTHAFFFRDAGQFSYPLAYYLHDCFWRAEIPLWNPYNNCGIPFLAQWNTLVLYPGSLFYELLPLPWSLNYFILGHVFLAGLGMYWLALRWFGNRFAATFAGLMFAWNGLTINCWMWPCHIAALAWMPWVVLLVERAREGGKRATVWAVLAGACQMVTGSPELIIFTWLLVGGTFCVEMWREKRVLWRGAARIAALAVLVAAMSAAQMLPWLDLLAHGDRTSEAGDNTWAMPVWGAANFLVPLFRATDSITGVLMQPGQEWTTSYYVGILTVLLALLALWKLRDGRVLFLGAVAIGGVLCAMGDSGLILKLLRTVVPAIGVVRFPIKFVVLTIFCLPLLAAAGIAWWQRSVESGKGRKGDEAEHEEEKPRISPMGRIKDSSSVKSVKSVASDFSPGRGLYASRYTLLVMGGVLAVAVVVLAFIIPGGKLAGVTAKNAAVRLLVLAGGLGIIVLQARVGGRGGKLALSFAFLLVSGLDVCSHVPRQNPTIPVRDYGAMPGVMDPVPKLGESRAMLSREVQILMNGLVNPDMERLYLGQRSMLFSDCNLLDKIPKVNGFFSIHPREEARVAALLYGEHESPGLEEFLGVSQYSPSLFTWVARTNFMPWASIGQAPVFLNDAAALTALSQTNFDPRRIVYLPAERSDKVIAAADPTARILKSAMTAESCGFETQSATPTVLVMAQSYYPCWQASVDGKAVPLIRANVGFQAVEVQDGKHQIVFQYKDRAFQLGCAISVLALLFCAVNYFSKNK